MQITGKFLLSSAESLLEKKDSDRADKPAAPRQTTDTSAEYRPAALHARLMHLQGSMAALQKDYTREQVRLSYLDDPGSLDEPTFEGEPLFPDKATEEPDLRSKVQSRLEGIARSLRGLQVEMENLAALGSRPATAGDARFLLEGGGIHPMDPDRVSRLTR